MLSNKSGKYAAALTLFALVIAECSSGYEFTMVFSAIPTFNRVFGDPVKVGWLITIFLLVSASVTAIAARLGDIYGRRRVLLVLLAIAFTGSLVSAWSETLTWVIVGRAIQGIAAAILPLCIGLARENFEVEKVPLAVGVILAAATLAAGAGLVVGGYIVDHYAWQDIFYSSAGLAAVGFVLVWLFVPPSKPAELKGPIDYMGGVLFIPPVACLMYALSKAREWGVLDERTLGLVAVSLLLLFVWVKYELRQKEPLIDVRLLVNRQVALANISVVLLGLGALQIYLIFAMFMQQPLSTGAGLGLTATLAGMVMLPSQLVGTFSSPFSGWVAARFSARTAALLGTLILVGAWGALMLHHSGLWYVASVTVFAAIGLYIVYVAIPNLLVEAVPESRTAEAAGMAMVMRAASQGVGALVVSLLLSTYMISSSESGSDASYPSSQGYILVFGFVFFCSVAMLFTILALPCRKRHRESQQNPAAPIAYKR